MSWLCCDVDATNRSLVALLWFQLCRRYEVKFFRLKHFSKVWLDGSSNQKTSSNMDNEKCDQHKHAVTRQKEDQARKMDEPVTLYSVIAKVITMKKL